MDDQAVTLIRAGRLSLVGVGRHQQGTYRCVASNTHGQAFLTLSVTVSGQSGLPHPVSHRLTLSLTVSDQSGLPHPVSHRLRSVGPSPPCLSQSQVSQAFLTLSPSQVSQAFPTLSLTVLGQSGLPHPVSHGLRSVRPSSPCLSPSQVSQVFLTRSLTV